MSYCLGLHISDNYIKYAKVKIEENTEPKIEVFGVDFYDNLQLALERIINETYSFDVDVIVNLENESYNSFEVFSGMDYSNLKKHIGLLFAEEVCAKNNLIPSNYEKRFIRIRNDEDQDSTKVLLISSAKNSIAKTKQLAKGKIKRILPIPLANLSLLNLDKESNFVILNIDAYTTLTVVVKGCVKEVININTGMNTVLAKLAKIYKTYSKSYNQCKNVILMNDKLEALTASTKRRKKDADEDNSSSDVEIVTPILYDIVEQVNENLNDYIGVVNKMYITGSAVIINNIDLYFEDSLNNMSVQLLKPYFISSSLEANQKTKDIVEANSAIALAISPTTINEDNIDFGKQGVFSGSNNSIMNNKNVTKIIHKAGVAFKNLKGKAKSAISNIKEKNKNKTEKAKAKAKSKNKKTVKKDKVKFDLKVKLEQFNKTRVSTAPKLILTVLVFILVAYVATTTLLNNKYQEGIATLNGEMGNLNAIMSTIQSDIDFINTNKQKYTTLQASVGELISRLNEVNGLTNDIPSFLTRIALIMPDEVVITNIEINNNNAKIEAECESYAPLGFFISGLKAEEVMSNVATQLVEDPILQKVIIKGVVK